ncbi:MAG TPA: hypothetical protein VF796_16880, partial [Humisphaera sp.]
MASKAGVLGGLAGVLGGGALLAHVAMWVGYDAQANQNLGTSTTSPYWLVDRLTFSLALLLLGVAVVELGVRLARSRIGRDGRPVGMLRRVTGGLGALAAIVPVAVGTMLVHALVTRDRFEANEFVADNAPFGVLGLLASAAVLGLALRRSGVLPAWTAVLLTLFGVGTPLLEMMLPAFAGRVRWAVLQEGHFVPAGLAWVAIGAVSAWTALRSRKEPASPDQNAAIAQAAPA